MTDFAYKPEQPTSTTVAAEVIVYDPAVLVEVLEELHHVLSDEPDEGDDDVGDSGLGDFGDLLLPRLVERGKVYSHLLEGYWRDLGQPHHYLNAHLELLREDLGRLHEDWPVRTQQPQREPARVLDGARISDSLLSSGCVVAGTVVRSVLGPGVVVEAGAVVDQSVVFRDTVVRAGASVTRSIVDRRCELTRGARVGDESVALEDPDAIAIIGRECRVSSAVKPGSRLAPGTTA